MIAVLVGWFYGV